MIFKTRKHTSGWTGKHLAYIPEQDVDADEMPNYSYVDGSQPNIGEASVDMDLPARHRVGMDPIEFVALLKVQVNPRVQTQVVEAGIFLTLLEAAQWAWAQNGRIADAVLTDTFLPAPRMIDSIADERFWSLPIVGADVAYYSQENGTLGDTVAF